MRNLIIIPTYNEAGNLRELTARIRECDPSSAILIVDDNSPDGTGKIADELKASLREFHVIHRAGKLGIGSAHVVGMEYARRKGFDTAITMDCDFTHRPEFLPQLKTALVREKADIVIGSRYLAKGGIATWPKSRQAITRTAHFLTTYLLGLPYDATNALRIYKLSRLPFKKIKAIKANGYAFMIEFLFTCHYHGMKIAEISVDLPIRNFGESKISKAEIVKAIERLIVLTGRRARMLPRSMLKGVLGERLG